MDKIPKHTIVFCKGLPGSGKSSWAREMSTQAKVQRVNKDDLRMMLNNKKYSKAKEKMVLKVRDAMIREGMQNGLSIIVDDTNLAPYHEETIRKMVDDFNKTSEIKYDFIVKFFEVDVMECIRRDNLRTVHDRVGPAVILRMYNKYLRGDNPEITFSELPSGLMYHRDQGYGRKQDESLPKAIVCDLDGTLAILKYRSPYDPKSCGSDVVNVPVKNVLHAMKDKGYHIILVSGRNDYAKYETERWLSDNWIPYDELHMRVGKDQRKDRIIKEEIFQQYIEGKYYIEFVLDDRDQVVDLWRLKLGLPVFQVNYGNF